MNKALILDEKTLKRIPPLFTLIFILLLGSPAIALYYFGIDFNSLSNGVDNHNSLGIFILETQIRSYFLQVLLQWSAFSLAAITTLLAFAQYRLTNDKIAFIIGLTILFSGAIEVFHTFIISGLTPYIVGKENIEAIIWTFTNTVSGSILMIGMLFLLKYDDKKIFHTIKFALLCFLLLLIPLVFIYFTAFIIKHPIMWQNHAWIAQCYEVISISIYLMIILLVYPSVYKKHPNILTNCIFYIAATQIVIAIYLIYLSNYPNENAYDIAYFLRTIVYFIPFSCLIINYVFSYNSILEAQVKLQKSQDELRYIASHDALTNLYNRREFEHLLDKTISTYSREYESFALFLIDLDNFKAINDSLGHLHGDSYLKKFSEQLTTLIRQGDILSRIGGDEFTVIMTKLKTPSSARKFAARIIRQLNMPFLVDDKLLTGTVSVGIAIYPMDGTTTEELLKNADIAMYNAKKSGKNTYRFYTEKLSAEQHREAEIESYLREALAKNEFRLVYQPIHDLITKEIIGAEVFLRWTNETLGEISPSEFLPVAENSHLLVQIGDWLLQNVCKQAEKWAEQYQRYLIFYINISPIQFSHRLFYQNFKQTIESFNYPAQYLSIEITENLLMEHIDDIGVVLRKLGNLGAKIVLDDFGIGYSSLNHLRSLPINTLKIDKSFIADIHNETEKVVVVDTIIRLADELGMTTIAEGIETQEQLNYLTSKHCRIGQGFFLNIPVTADVFETLAFLG